MPRKYSLPPKYIKRRKVRRSESEIPLISKKYESKLAKPFQNSDTIVIAGKLQKLSYGLQIRIAEDNQGKDLILDLFLNSLKRHSSDSEATDQVEVAQSYVNTHTINEIFFIQITAQANYFDIGIGNEKFTLHRENPSQTGQFLKVGGSIAFLTQVQHRSIEPVSLPLWHTPNLLRSENYFINDFPVIMRIGYVVIITALPYGEDTGSFEICFTQNQRPIPALKIMVDFEEPKSVELMGMNDNEEFEEEHLADFPFQINRKFRMAIGFTNDSFLLAINGNRFASFVYRALRLPYDLNGYYIHSNGGLKVKTLSTDHTSAIDCEYTGFEEYSDLNYQIT